MLELDISVFANICPNLEGYQDIVCNGHTDSTFRAIVNVDQPGVSDCSVFPAGLSIWVVRRAAVWNCFHCSTPVSSCSVHDAGYTEQEWRFQESDTIAALPSCPFPGGGFANCHKVKMVIQQIQQTSKMLVVHLV